MSGANCQDGASVWRKLNPLRPIQNIMIPYLNIPNYASIFSNSLLFFESLSFHFAGTVSRLMTACLTAERSDIAGNFRPKHRDLVSDVAYHASTFVSGREITFDALYLLFLVSLSFGLVDTIYRWMKAGLTMERFDITMTAAGSTIFTCNYCRHPGFKLERNLDKHVSDNHPQFVQHYSTAQYEASRQRKRAIDDIPANVLEKSVQEAQRRERQTQETNSRFKSTSQRLQSQSHLKATKDDVEEPDLGDDSQILTYLPHQVKSRTKTGSLGPKQNYGVEIPFTEIDETVWDGDQLENVPPEEWHSFDPRHKDFNPFYPFSNGDDFKKACYFINSRMPDSAITSFFNHGIGTAKILSVSTRFTSTYQCDGTRPR